MIRMGVLNWYGEGGIVVWVFLIQRRGDCDTGVLALVLLGTLGVE